MSTLASWTSGISPDRMREIDRVTEEVYGISPKLLMEVAGLATARVARSLMGSPLTGHRVSIVSGPGNNGGDGLVAARRLAGWGVAATVVTSYPVNEARGLARDQLEMARRAGVGVAAWGGEIPSCKLIIDALLGFGATGAPRGDIQAMILAANRAAVPVLSLDLPSGVDAETGAGGGESIRAAATVTLALVKTGLLATAARPFVGRLFLADIGVPVAVLRQVGVDSSGLFATDDIVELDPATGDIKIG